MTFSALHNAWVKDTSFVVLPLSTATVDCKSTINMSLKCRLSVLIKRVLQRNAWTVSEMQPFFLMSRTQISQAQNWWEANINIKIKCKDFDTQMKKNLLSKSPWSLETTDVTKMWCFFVFTLEGYLHTCQLLGDVQHTNCFICDFKELRYF